LPYQPTTLEHVPKLLAAGNLGAKGGMTIESETRPITLKAGLDLVGANRQELKVLGLSKENVFQSGLCTSCNEDLFFSHRRDRGMTGRHLAVVGFRR
jgi:copper oxidase (laccase) domain-containing protein